MLLPSPLFGKGGEALPTYRPTHGQRLLAWPWPAAVAMLLLAATSGRRRWRAHGRVPRGTAYP
eukprot:7741568-Prorocentrum_lima.AAC.1